MGIHMNFVFVVVYFETMNDVINVFKIKELSGFLLLSGTNLFWYFFIVHIDPNISYSPLSIANKESKPKLNCATLVWYICFIQYSKEGQAEFCTLAMTGIF